MADDGTTIFVCCEPDCQGCAERLDGWTHTNHDKALYDGRTDVAVESEAAEPIKRILRQQIQAAEVTVCLISQTTCLDAWIAWELKTAKVRPDRNALVGIVLDTRNPYPPAMVDSGTIFVSFKQDQVERAIEWALTQHDTSDDFTLQDD